MNEIKMWIFLGLVFFTIDAAICSILIFKYLYEPKPKDKNKNKKIEEPSEEDKAIQALHLALTTPGFWPL